MNAQLPDRVQVVVVGGGVIGTSIAWHLVQAGISDVLLIERDRLTSGTTWHAAGLMTTFGSLSETATSLRLYSRDLYARLEGLTGQSTGFRPVGLIEAAADDDRLHEYRRVATFQRLFGLEVQEISPREISELFCWARTDDLRAGFYVPGDGRVNPVDLTAAFAKGAKAGGARIAERVRLVDVLTTGDPQRVRAVLVEHGPGGEATRQVIECDTVVNCTGLWARETAWRSGVVVPNTPAEHYYLITDTIAGLTPDTPVFEDPAAYGYYREETGGMMVGLFEPVAASWQHRSTPDSSFVTLKPDWDRVGPYLERAMARVPVTLDTGVRTFFCGPESFTPDLAPCVGEAPGIAGYFVCAGMNSVGVLSAGGLGRILAHWIGTGRPDVDVTGFHVDRFRHWQLDPDYRAARTSEILGTVYAGHTPGRHLTSGRNRFHSPVHDRLVAAGGYLREVSGWESPAWFAGPGTSPRAVPGWGPQPWFAHWRAEHEAVRTRVGLIDLSFMAAFTISGAGADGLIDGLCAGEVTDARITYTPILDEDGRLDADVTVLRHGPGDYLMVATDTAHGHVDGLLRRAAARGGYTEITDITAGRAQFAVQGPASRELLTGLGLDLSDFGFRTARRVVLAGVDVVAARITYVGELGWELTVAHADANAVYDAVMTAGSALGITPVGLSALGSLRLEKGYRDYGHDIDNTDCVLEAGLGFAVRPGLGFTGSAAVQARRVRNRRAGGPPRRLVQVMLTDPQPLLHHGEPVYRDDRVVGYLRSASYGWTLGGAVGLAMVDGGGTPVTQDWLASGPWEVDIAGVRYGATASARPLYDPAGVRVRG